MGVKGAVTMPKSENQKLKLLVLLRFLEEKSDEDHPVRLRDIQKELEKYEIRAERKTIYSDLEALRAFGYDVQQAGGDYWLGERRFELAELKLLVDSVQASRFITRKKSGELINKLEALTSVGEARQLQRQVYVRDRPEPGAKSAVTRYRLLKSANGLSLVECTLLTGRTHQIRAQMAHAGWPLLGDGKYGSERENRRMGETEGQALYSYRLRFDFPTDAGILEYLRGREFTVSRIGFVEKYFPDYQL